MQKPVYFDNHATTPVDPRVLEAMLPFFHRQFGNAASRSHSFGWQADQAVERARQQVAEFLGAGPREIVFTSGATESNNLALKGACQAYHRRGGHVISIATEHHAVLDPLRHLERSGIMVTLLPPRADGLLEVDQLEKVLRPETILVSVMAANNEIGVIQPLAAIGALCRERGVLFHTDAAQAAGRAPLPVRENRIDVLSLTAHKIYGPKGVGAVYVRRGVELIPQIDGGGQEGGIRSGTLNVPGIVGFGEACALAARELNTEAPRLRALRDRLKARIETALAGVRVNGSMEQRLPGNLNLSFAGIQAAALLAALPDIAVSTGSACNSATPEPSHVLRALGLSAEEARSSVRFGIGRFNTEEEVDYVADRVVESVRNLRAAVPK
jgi:cysteine desulfurase